MASAAPLPAPAFPPPHGLLRIFAWRRVLVTASLCVVWGWVISHGYVDTPRRVVIGRELVLGIMTILAFGIFERFPAKLPGWIARWVLQVAGVAIVIPLTMLVMYTALGLGDGMPWWKNERRVNGFLMMMMTTLLIAPWVAVAAIFRQRDDAERHRALAFALERSELERKAVDARLRLLQSQVEPHFLFNTLANVRELVDSGSPKASTVLDSLIAYLRAAVPRLNDPATTLGQELDLVRAYLQLMHMRMPDRLVFTLQVDPEAEALRCPPTTVLTLAENAVRHGIDPSEDGGTIEVRVKVCDNRVCAQVRDTGVGLGASRAGLGTGLATLRERLQLAFGGDASLRLEALEPRGAVAEVEFPAQRGAAG